MCGIGGVGKGVGVVAEEVTEVEGVGNWLGDVDGSVLRNVSFGFFILFFHSLFFILWKKKQVHTVELA